MNYMTDFEIGKCIELGRKRLNSPESIIKYIRLKRKKLKKKEKSKSLETITKNVCDYFGEDEEDLLKPTGNGAGRDKLVRIRQISSLIASIDYGYHPNEIAKYLLRDRVTIFISKTKAQNFYNNEKRYKLDVDNCRELILLEKNK